MIFINYKVLSNLRTVLLLTVLEIFFTSTDHVYVRYFNTDGFCKIAKCIISFSKKKIKKSSNKCMKCRGYQNIELKMWYNGKMENETTVTTC